INTRDETHVDASRYRRFHVILGDSNMSEWATALKIGTTALVLDLIERGQAPQLEIAQPVDANKSISRDQNYDWIIELKDGRKISAIEVQRIYLRAAAKVDPPSPGSGAAGNFADEDRQWILQEWENGFNDQIASIQWDELVFANGPLSRRVALPEAFGDARLDALNHAARNGKDFSEFMRVVSAID